MKRPIYTSIYMSVCVCVLLYIYNCQLHAQVLMLQENSHTCTDYLNLLRQKIKIPICILLENSEVPNCIWLRLVRNKKLESEASWFNIVFKFL
jgi:hypothetical protein